MQGLNRMEGILKENDNHLPVSALQLLVPPIRLMSAAAWQTIQHNVVANYGDLAEFASIVTDLVPELITRRQRAQLILGLRARLILELCHCDSTANFDIVQPHLDRIQSLIEKCVMEVDATTIPNSEFVDLISSMLKHPDKREYFFQKIFPVEFGPSYHEALHALMWLFLSNLEKLLPLYTFEQVGSMLGEASTVLVECMDTVFQCKDLKTLLHLRKDLHQLDSHDGSLDDVSIISALKLSFVEGTETPKTQIQDNISDCVLSSTPDLEKESQTLPHAVEINTDTDHQNSKIKTDKTSWTPVSNGLPMDQLLGDNERNDDNTGHSQSQKQDASHLLKKCHVHLLRLEMPLSSHFRPERKNRGLRMKKICLKEKRGLREETYTSHKKPASPDWAPPEISDSEDSSRFQPLSYMAPISNCSEDDSWSYYSEGESLHKRTSNSPSLADSWSCYSEEDSLHRTTVSSPSIPDSWSSYSDDTSSVVDLVSRFAEDNSLSGCSKKDHPLMDPINVSVNGSTSGMPSIKASTPKRVRKVVCFICKEHVTTVLKKHMRTHFPTGVYACPQCSRKFKLMASLKIHMQRTCYEYNQQQVDPEKPDESNSLYKCDTCQKAFRHKVSLDKHKVTHNELYCNVCRRVLRDAEMLARHKVSHTPFQCPRCKESFTHFLPLQWHFDNIHEISRPLKCKHCLKILPKLRTLILHEWTHTGHLPFQCAQCNVRFRSDADLIHHHRVHTKEKPYLCSECGKTFAQTSNLSRHYRLLHSEFRNVRRYSCSQCDKSFKERGALIKHQRSKHLNELFRHPCPYCGKMVSMNTLTRHKLMHTGQRPFKCTVPECDKFFRSTSEVKRHVLYHHSTDRPFKCGVCEKAFVKMCYLTAHAKVHSGVKPFVCHICGKAFLKLYSMQRHKNLVHTFISH
ncbi:hypothetical protein Q5P01_023953 [Channa striata]|uniref:C2H2-type domain-containing protein n=1 Tax=Channa striata TaxID=64152 RepID=A0AA88IUJ3_CHASR|nr:hypothetical protein Q5P01_023953 [Channa striata]